MSEERYVSRVPGWDEAVDRIATIGEVHASLYRVSSTDAVDFAAYLRRLCDRLADSLIDSLNFLGLLLAANVLALVFYVFSGPFAPLLFWGLNGWLLGREYFTLVAMRRVGRAAAKTLRGHHAGRIWLAGTLMAAPLSIPLVNLAVPVLGVATFTHLFHAITARR